MEKLKVAVISCGMISNTAHLPAYLYSKDKCEVVSVCDLNEEAARQTAERFGVKSWYSDTEKMLAAEKPDLVSVCVPNGFHKPVTMLALSYGANVLCEKPVALSYKDAKEMYQEAERTGKVLEACQVIRYYPEFMFAKEMHEQDILGNIYFSEFSITRRRGIPKWGAFHKKAASGGGVLCDLGVHMIDAALWIMGDQRVEAVSGMTASNIAREDKDIVMSIKESGAPNGVFTKQEYSPDEFEVEEFATGSMRLKNGSFMNFKTSWALNLPPEFNMKLAGTKAGLILPEMKLYGTMGRYQTDFAPRVFADEAPFADEPFPGHYLLIENLLNHILNGEDLMIKPAQTMHVTAIIDAFYRSAAEGREVLISEVEQQSC